MDSTNACTDADIFVRLSVLCRTDDAACHAASRACRTSTGWKHLHMRTPITHGRGATMVAVLTNVALALAFVLSLAFGLTLLEHRLERDGLTRALFGITTAHAAEASAPLLIRSHHMPVTVAAGDTVTLSLGFKNAGEWAWVKGAGSTAILERATPNGPSIFMANDWVDTMRATFQDEDRIAPGSLALFSATFRAPLESGTTTDRFILRTLDGRALLGSETEVTMIVVATTPVASAALASSGSINLFGTPSSTNPATGSDGTDPFFIAETIRYPEEPTIRIGIDYVEPTNGAWDPHVITADVAFRVTEESGSEVLTVPAGDRIGIDYRPADNTFHIKHGTDWFTAREPVRIAPATPDPRATLRLASYNHTLRWETNEVDDLFRGTLEIRYVPSTERLWVINELPIEDYVRGLVETSDDAHPEFHKAQVVAARTFALYHLERGGKYQKGQFILRSDARDQVYRGERAAQRRPNLVAAAEATRGVVVTHGGDVVVTPYYAQDDGRTRGWHEKWGGAPRPWLLSVTDPVCDGKRLIGHGVGMAQRCAMTLANQGWVWQSLLHHYYTGIELRKLWE